MKSPFLILKNKTECTLLQNYFVIFRINEIDLAHYSCFYNDTLLLRKHSNVGKRVFLL